MSVRARRAARHERRGRAREDRLAKLREGTDLRASRGWATVIQALAFVRKELAEIFRQPKLLVLLVAGPFVLLLLFGAGYKDTTIRLRTEFVGPEDSVYEQAINEYADQLDEFIDPRGFTSDEQAARRALENGDLDAVVVFPDDALDQILGGASAEILILHEKLDPFQQAAIEISSRLAVQEVNASVLGAIAGGTQAALTPIRETAIALTEQAADLTAAATDGRAADVEEIADQVTGSLGAAELVLTTSREVMERLGGDDQAEAVAAVLGPVGSAVDEADALREAPAGDLEGRAAALAADLRDVAAAMDAVTTLDPAVLVRPFAAETESIAPVDIEPADFFAPPSIVLLLQHLALTFAALSLVRDRELGLFELLRVGPLSSVEILAGKTIAYLVIGAGVGAALVAAAVFVLGVPMQGEVVWVAVAVVMVLLASLALGLVLSMISGSETQAVQYAMLTLLAGLFFSGFILDVSNLAEPYRYLSYLLPVTYGINLLQDVMLRGDDPATTDLVGLGALVVAYGSLAILLLHRRLRTE